MPPRPGKPCRFQSTQAALRTPIGQQQHSNKIQSVPGAHVSSVTSRTTGRVDAVAPSSPPSTQLRDWGPETQQQPAPIVDNFVDDWEQDVPPHPVAYTDDVEDVYHTTTAATTTGSSWGSWSGRAAVANTLWEADRWSIQPDDVPSMLDQRDLEELGEFNIVRTEDITQDQPVAAPMQVPTVSEDDPRRYKYHSALYAAAKQGDVTEVQQILRTMSEVGLPPGSAALHSLVFAHVKAGQSQEGLEAARNILKLGLSLLEETYIALLYGLAEEGRVEDAEGVIVSMYNNAGGTIRNGWLALTKGLFRKGDNITVAFQHLQKGLQEGWNPDASLFEYVIEAFCKADNIEQAQRVLASMPDLGCPPRTVHINLLVELVARLQGIDAALEFIQDTYAQLVERAQTEVGSESTHKAVPNNDTFCAVFRGYMHEKGPEMQPGTAVEMFGKVTAAMMSADVFVGPQIMAYGLDLFLMDGELESSLEQISSLRTVAGEGWSEYVDDTKMLALLTACGSADRPVDLAVLLRELERRSRHMPCAVLPTNPDSTGRPVSALTSWLPSVAADDKIPKLPSADRHSLQHGSFAHRTALILESANISGYDGSVETIEVEVKAPKYSKAGDLVEEAVYKEVKIGIGKCAVTDDGLPMKLNSMLKVHLLAELQARGDARDPKSKAADLKAEVKLQRDIIEPQIETFQQLDGGAAMGQVQSLIASGMSPAQAMAEVQSRFSLQSMGGLVDTPVADATPDDAEDDESDEEAEEDEFGVSLATEVWVTEYVSWKKLRREKRTYGQLNEEERKAFRTMEKYTSPGSNAKSTSARRTEALESVIDDAQAQLDGRSGWQSDAANGGLLSQFEGDLHLGEGDEGETSLSDGVGAPHPDDQDDAQDLMMAAGGEDGSSMVDLEPDDEGEGDSDGVGDEDDPAAELASGEDAGDSDEEQSGVDHESMDDGDGTVSLLDDGESDDEEESSPLLDLTRFTNDSAGVEVAMECLRCARQIGIVISRGDFENTLAAAKQLKNPQYMTLLHGWALEQATEVFTAAELDGPDAEAVRNFTSVFCGMARQALLDMGRPSEAVESLAENEQVVLEQVSTGGV